MNTGGPHGWANVEEMRRVWSGQGLVAIWESEDYKRVVSQLHPVLESSVKIHLKTRRLVLYSKSWRRSARKRSVSIQSKEKQCLIGSYQL